MVDARLFKLESMGEVMLPGIAMNTMAHSNEEASLLKWKW